MAPRLGDKFCCGMLQENRLFLVDNPEGFSNGLVNSESTYLQQ